MASPVRLRVALAFAPSAAGDPDAVAEASAALDLARRSGDKQLLHYALAACRAATAGSWDVVSRRRLVDEQETLALDRGGHTDALLCRSEVRLVVGDASGAVADLEAAAAETGFRALRSPSMLIAMGAAALRVGDFAAAEAAASDTQLADARGDLALAATIMRGWLAHERGSQPTGDGALGPRQFFPRRLPRVLHAMRCADDGDEAATSAAVDSLAGLTETGMQDGPLAVLVQAASALAAALYAAGQRRSRALRADGVRERASRRDSRIALPRPLRPLPRTSRRSARTIGRGCTAPTPGARPVRADTG